MAEKNSSKPIPVRKPVRTAKTPRAFPGQPEVQRTPRGSILIPQDTFLRMMRGELPEQSQELLAAFAEREFAPAPDCSDESEQDWEARLEDSDSPHFLVTSLEDDPEHVRVAISKFEIQELYPGSNMLVAGAHLTNDGLVGLIRSLMTIAHGRGMICRL